jgi:hypothetical protein
VRSSFLGRGDQDSRKPGTFAAQSGSNLFLLRAAAGSKEVTIPDLNAKKYALDRSGLEKMDSKSAEPEASVRPIQVDIAQSGTGTTGDATFGIIGVSDITGGKKRCAS